MMQSLGYITVPTPGTPVQATFNVVSTDKSQPFTKNNWPAHGLLFQVSQNNVGRIYILGPDGNKSTGVGLLAVLAIPSSTSLPSASFTITIAGSALDANLFYIDSDLANDACLVSALVL